jgi:thioredoxin reductase
MSSPVLIVGAGPAGLACADQLSRAGQRVVIIDDNAQAGGQYFRQLPATYPASPNALLLRDKSRFDPLAKVLKRPEVTHLASTTVWGTPAPLTLAYGGASGSGRIQGSAIVVASGAQDKPFPFSGWTLPGVVSAGGCLNLAKAHGLIPTGRVVVVGNGPLVLVAAATLAAAGADIVGVAEAQPSHKLFGAVFAGLWAVPKLLMTAAYYRTLIRRAGAWFRTGWMVAEATGSVAIEKVALAPIDGDGKPFRQRAEWHEVDTLVSGYGLIPSTDCAMLLGCDMQFDPSLNGIVPKRSATLETSIPKVYAVGDGAGVGGVEVALLEGRIAGDAILGNPSDPSLLRKYQAFDRFRRKLNVAYAPKAPLSAARPETIVCRCEELTLEDLFSDPNARKGDLDRLKKSSRIGMGRCQGRNCLPALPRLLDMPAGNPGTMPRTRPPIRPLQLRYLVADADAGPAREPDEVLIHTRGVT